MRNNQPSHSLNWIRSYFYTRNLVRGFLEAVHIPGHFGGWIMLNSENVITQTEFDDIHTAQISVLFSLKFFHKKLV